MTASGNIESGPHSSGRAKNPIAPWFPRDRDIRVLQIPLSLRAWLHYDSTILLMTRPHGDA
jgi:hypothetical protein